jgi:ribonucleases P/MRP protein subunit RPP40
MPYSLTAKAFDKVPHRRLLEKIKSIGIKGQVLGWIENWLCGRQQRIVLDSKASSEELVSSGVPQGSVLGPVLFLIFIRGLDRAVPDGVRIHKFADNTKVAKTVALDQDAAVYRKPCNRCRSGLTAGAWHLIKTSAR